MSAFAPNWIRPNADMKLSESINLENADHSNQTLIDSAAYAGAVEHAGETVPFEDELRKRELEDEAAADQVSAEQLEVADSGEPVSDAGHADTGGVLRPPEPPTASQPVVVTGTEQDGGLPDWLVTGGIVVGGGVAIAALGGGGGGGGGGGNNDQNLFSPTFTSDEAVSVAEGEALAQTVTATDLDEGSSVSFSISGGSDQDLFSIDSNSGALRFLSAPDFEAPADANTDNDYQVTVTASDGENETDQAIRVSVTNVAEDGVNDAPSITSNGGGASAGVDFEENGDGLVTTVTAEDLDADPAPVLSFSLGDFDDADLFSIDAVSGELSFVTPPDFENPTDQGGDGDYEVTVIVDDGLGGSDQQRITVTVTDTNEAPNINSDGGGDNAVLNFIENSTADVTTVAATDPESDNVTYSIVDGADGALFSIDENSGVLRFLSAPDFDSPQDQDGDNNYQVTVRADDRTDASGLFDTQNIVVSVSQSSNNAPPLTVKDDYQTDEDVELTVDAVNGVLANDSDPDGNIVNVELLNPAANGAVVLAADGSFTYTPDADFSGTDSFVYRVTDDDGSVAVGTASITVGANNDAPVIEAQSFTIAENSGNATLVGVVAASDVEGDDLSFAITAGNDGGAFQIDPDSGAITVADQAPLDFETTPSFSLTVQVDDGERNAEAQITLDLSDVNEAPSAADQQFDIVENSAVDTVVGTVLAQDPETDALSFSIDGGNQAGAFQIDPDSGEISVADAAPLDFETTTSFVLTVGVSDGEFSDSAQITIDVTNDPGDDPMASSAGAGAVILDLENASAGDQALIELLDLLAYEPQDGPLYLIGDAGDVLELGEGIHDSGSDVAESGYLFDVYDAGDSGLQLLVDQDFVIG